ncbi:MAG: serine/threonine-protein kinase [Thermoanaerobaculia bacterium]|nr:serine/threonine-protein kinase [Thermoanaerobaculia bacterium]
MQSKDPPLPEPPSEPSQDSDLEPRLRSGNETDSAISTEFAGRILPTGPTEGDFESGDTTHLPRRIGGFHILKILGEGGMGVVYLALQTEPIERRVALKVIRQSLRYTSIRARFDAERQALARLSHPGIGQVYEAGDTADGAPYFAMELIEGPRISEFCNSKRLGIEERIQLFRRICEAVHHVHQKGVVHRDLKDDNILVAVSSRDAEPQPKVIDFGIARALDQSEGAERLTRVGRFIGTPGYLSPEMIQGTGGDDLRVDVYALGVLLFKLLVGELPFEQGESSVMSLFHRMIVEDAPTLTQRLTAMSEKRLVRRAELRGLSPAAWKRRLRGDLDAIVSKAMAKDPDDRYGSAAELADDLQRHLTYEPIRAETATWWQQTQKFAHRYRGTVLSVAVVLLVLAGGLWARSQEAARANREAAAAREVSDFLVELFEVSDPGESLGEEITARELLDRGSERIRRDLADQPITRARLLDTIGVVYERLGLFDAAVNHLEEALDLRRRELGDLHPDVLHSLVHLGKAQWSRGRLAEAEPFLRQAVDGWRQLGSPRPLARALGRLGMLYELQQDYEQAGPPLREALTILQRTGEPLDVAAAYDDLAVFHVDQEHNAEAIELFERALAIRETELGSLHPEVATTLNGLAIAMAQGGDLAASEPLFRRALEVRRHVLGADHAQLAQSLNNLASCLKVQGHGEESLPLYEEALDIWSRTLGDDSARVGQVLDNLGDVLEELGRLEAAEARYRQSIGVYEAYLARESALGRSPDLITLSHSLDDLADLLRDQGRLEEATSLYQRIYQLRLDERGPDDELTLEAKEQLESLGTAGS